MENTIENNKKIISSGEFTKDYLKIMIFNLIIFSILYAIIMEVVSSIHVIIHFLAIIVCFVICVKKIYMDSISETFKNARIYREDIGKIKRNINIIFLVIFLMNVVSNIISAISAFELAKYLSMEKELIFGKVLAILIQGVASFVFCILTKKRFSAECTKEENIA